MTKEQFIRKWGNCTALNLSAVIAYEIAKAKEQPQPALNEIEKAYHNYEPIRWILWNEGWNIKKHSDTESIDRNGKIYDNKSIVFNFDTNPEEWQLYKEPTEHTEQVTDQVTDHEKQAPKFDKERFEAMFRAVIETHEATMNALAQLDAYYATKEGGNNE